MYLKLEQQSVSDRMGLDIEMQKWNERVQIFQSEKLESVNGFFLLMEGSSLSIGCVRSTNSRKAQSTVKLRKEGTLLINRRWVREERLQNKMKLQEKAIKEVNIYKKKIKITEEDQKPLRSSVIHPAVLQDWTLLMDSDLQDAAGVSFSSVLCLAKGFPFHIFHHVKCCRHVIFSRSGNLSNLLICALTE